MPYLVDIREDLNEEVQEEIRKYRLRCHGTDFITWYRINIAYAKSRIIGHVDLNDLTRAEILGEDGNPISWYHWRDPEQSQVSMVNRNLKECLKWRYSRARVTSTKLKEIMKEILDYRIKEYQSHDDGVKQKKILCIVGESGCGKTLASLHLKYYKDANVVCSFTTREPRSTEVEGRDHHFIDIVPDRSELLAYTHFGGAYYYALKCQVYGECTVYVIDEKGLVNMRKDNGDEYRIYSVLIKRDKKLRKRCGVSEKRMGRDRFRHFDDEDYDYIVVNNGTKKEFFQQIEAIYDEVYNLK